MKVPAALIALCLCVWIVACDKKSESATPPNATSESRPSAASTNDNLAAQVFHQNFERALLFRRTASNSGLLPALQEAEAAQSLIKRATSDSPAISTAWKFFFATTMFIADANQTFPTEQVFVMYSPFFDAIAAVRLGMEGRVLDLAVYPAERLIDPTTTPTVALPWFNPEVKRDWRSVLIDRVADVQRKANDFYVRQPASPGPLAPLDPKAENKTDAALKDGGLVLARLALISDDFRAFVIEPKWERERQIAAAAAIYLTTGDKALPVSAGVTIPPESDAAMSQWPMFKRQMLDMQAAIHLGDGWLVWMQNPDAPQKAVAITISSGKPPQLLWLDSIPLVDVSKVPELKH